MKRIRNAAEPEEPSLKAPPGVLPGWSRNLLLVGAVLAAIGAGLYEGQEAARQRRQAEALAHQIQLLQQEREAALKRLAAPAARPALRLPVPPVQFSTSPTETGERAPATNVLACFQGLKAKAPNRLTAEQVEPYLRAHGRKAASLLAAYRATGDGALLAEAIQKYSDDPQVALAAVLQKEASPEVRRQWLDTFKQTDPGNALPYYLSALNYLQTGQPDQAMPELAAASSRSQFRDYSAQRLQGDEEIYLAAGYPETEALAMAPLQQALYLEASGDEEVGAAFATFPSQLSLHAQIKALAVSLKELARSYAEAGDPASGQAALQMGMNLGQRYSTMSGENGLGQLVGMAAEVLSLAGMDAKSPYGVDGQTVQERIGQLRQQRTAIRGLYQQAVPLLGSLSEQDWASYNERARFFGEPAALQWVVGKCGQK